MIINQWVPAAHDGDAIGDSARRVRDMLRAMGHTSDLYALTIDDSLRDDVRPFDDAGAARGDATIFHYALAVADDGAVRATLGRRILQYHNITPAHFFAPYEPGLFRLAVLGRRELATLAGRVDYALGDSDYNRRELEELGFAETGVLPIAVDTARMGRLPAQRALTRLLDDGLTNILFVGRLAPQQENRGPPSPGRGLQAVRRRRLPIHLRRPVRRRAPLLHDDPSARNRVQDALRSILVHRARTGTPIWQPSTAPPTPTSH